MIILAGDSWADKAYTNENFDKPTCEEDVCLADFWQIEYRSVVSAGKGNLDLLNLVKSKAHNDIPIIWIYTEPGRDYHILTGRPEFEWMTREDYFEIRPQLNKEIFSIIRQTLKNPIALIGGLSDVDVALAESNDLFVLDPSWQKWIANKLESSWFKFGWGASDVGWRAHYNNVTPGHAVTFAWDEQIKEWCWWSEQGYFCHEHPTPRANKEFAEFLKPNLLKWLSKYE